ncbi:MAG TPA: hypothetical protein VNX26_14180 [Candidatus Acidoferrum sp.]|jgi:hypothetical protein|nr:hypothetical protein [Candidatus Acidoferrum sp.]
MKTIRRFAYAAVLTLSALNFAPSLASAQDASGTFTLTHEVHWQKAIVPAGKYRFTLVTNGPSELLTLRKTSGGRASFILLVTDTDASEPSDLSRLVVVSRPSGSFVSTMQLPEFGLTLHFAVPSETREVARSIATSSATSGATSAASAAR